MAKKKINSRAKGQRGERAWRDRLIQAGFAATRGGQQGAGGSADAPDVVCPALRDRFHPEVKNVESLNVRKALEQAIADADDGQVPYVAWKKNRADWVVTLRGDDFLAMVKKIVESQNN